MSIFLLSYLPAICLGVAMIYLSFAPHLSPRVGVLVLTFGALVSCFMLIKFIILDSSIVVFSNRSSFVPINFGIYLGWADIVVITTAIFSFIITLFLVSKKRFSSNVNFLCIIYLVIISPYMFSNLIISFAAFSIASVFIMYFSIINNERKLSTAHLTTDFIWHRASDVAAFISLFLILINNKSVVIYKLINQSPTSPSPYAPLFFAALIARLVTMPASNNYIKFSTDNGFNYFVLGRIFSSIGAILFLYKINSMIFDPIKSNGFYLITIGILLFHVIFSISKHNKIIYLPINLSYFCLICSLTAMAFGKAYIALIIILILIILTPVLILLTSQIKLLSKKNQEAPGTDEDPILIVGRLAQSFAHVGATIAARFASIVYANFLFYRLPQLIISLFQMPLRLFHTGSIQRSVLFIVLLMASYYWLWG